MRVFGIFNDNKITFQLNVDTYFGFKVQNDRTDQSIEFISVIFYINDGFYELFPINESILNFNLTAKYFSPFSPNR